MNSLARMLKMQAILSVAALFMFSFSTVGLFAGPPMPEDITPEEEEEFQFLFEGFEAEILRFSEDYVDLIEELEIVLDEFDEFFQEFGQVSIKEYEKALKRLQLTLSEEYSSENHQEMMQALDDLLKHFQQLEMELENSEVSVQKKRLRNLRALEEDLEDIREQLVEEVDDARLIRKIDAAALSEVIAKAFEEAQRAMAEARKAYEENLLLVEPVSPVAPAAPLLYRKDVKKGTGGSTLLTLQTGDFDGSLSQSASVSIPNKATIIELENAIGGVETETWNRSEISAELTIGYLLNSKKSRSLAEEIKLFVDDTQGLIRIRVLYPDDDDESINIVASRLEVSLPRANPVKITNSFGPVVVAELDNSLDIHSNFSDIEVQNIKGSVCISNSSGAIYLENITGGLKACNSFAPIEAVFINGDINLSNSYSMIRIEKSSGTLDINTSGEVFIDHFKGNAAIHSGNGALEIFDITGNLTAINSFGSILAEKIGGDAEIENANAPIEIIGVGGTLKVSNNFAPIVIEEIGRDVTVRSSNGNVTIENIKGGVNVVNRFGEVTIHTVAGSVEVINSGEPVTISEVLASVKVVNQFSPVMISTITGEVSVDNMNASVDLIDIKGASTVKTSYGLISGENLVGPFVFSNDNGSVELLRVVNIDSDCQVTTTHGDITLELPQAGSYNLSATTSYGEIDTDLPMTVNSNGNITSGTYIAGKSNPTITLTGDNSSIKIRTE